MTASCIPDAALEIASLFLTKTKRILCSVFIFEKKPVERENIEMDQPPAFF